MNFGRNPLDIQAKLRIFKNLNFHEKRSKKVHLSVDLVCFYSNGHPAEILLCDAWLS